MSQRTPNPGNPVGVRFTSNTITVYCNQTTLTVVKCKNLHDAHSIGEVLHILMHRHLETHDAAAQHARSKSTCVCVLYMCVPLKPLLHVLVNQLVRELQFIGYKLPDTYVY